MMGIMEEKNLEGGVPVQTITHTTVIHSLTNYLDRRKPIICKLYFGIKTKFFFFLNDKKN